MSSAADRIDAARTMPWRGNWPGGDQPAPPDAGRWPDPTGDALNDDSGPQPRRLDFRELSTRRAPERGWLLPGWFLKKGAHALAGAGGSSKSMLSTQVSIAGAVGRAFITPEHDSFTTLLINCEDDHDELWRRIEEICGHWNMDMASLAGKLHVESWHGCDNALMVKGRDGSLLRTPRFDQVREMVNDLRCDALMLDNVAHLFVGDHSSNTEVTQFVNACAGLASDRDLATLFTLHTARAQGSEFSGSAAWENAVRSRWFLSTKHPDQVEDPGDEVAPSTVRFLSRRKANYAGLDYVRFTMQGALLLPDQVPSASSGMMAAIDDRRAEEVCLAGFRSLVGMGLEPSDKPQAGDYLPKQLAAKGLATGFTKAQLTKAMNRLMTAGVLTRGVVGKHTNRTPKMGLVLQEGRSK